MGWGEGDGFVGCEPEFAGPDSCSGLLAPNYCISYTDWQGNANRMIIATWVMGCAMLATMCCYGVCKLDRGEKSLGVLKVLLGIFIVGWTGLSFGGGITGIDRRGTICRGVNVHAALSEGYFNRGYFNDYSWWSLEPLRFSEYGDIVPGYDKTRGTFLLWMGITLLGYVFAFAIVICSSTTKVKRLSDLGNPKPRKMALN